MKIMEIVLYVIAVVFSFSTAFGIRTLMRTGKGAMNGTLVTTMFYFLSLICVIIFSLSPLHLIWMFIASWIMGFLSLIFPFSLFVIPARYFAAIYCIGITRDEVGK